MRKRIVKTAIACVCFISLFIYANFYEVEEITEPGTLKPFLLLQLKADDVKKLTIVNSEGELRLHSGAEGFEIVHPGNFRSDRTELDAILGKFENFKAETTVVKNADDMKDFGLGSGSPILRLETATATFEFTLGSKSPIGGEYFLKRNDDPAVYLVPGYVAASFKKTLSDLRARDIFHDIPDLMQIASISLTVSPFEEGSQPVTFELERRNQNKWELTAPRALPADQSEVQNLVAAMKELRVSRFVTDNRNDDADYGFHPPRVLLRLFDKEGKTQELIAGKTEGKEVFLKRGYDPAVYTVQEYTIFRFEKSLDDLRDKRLSQIDIADVREISLTLGTQTVDLSFRDGEWFHKEMKVEKEIVVRLITAFANNHVREYLPWEMRGEKGLADDQNNDRFTLKTSLISKSVRFGNGDGSEIAVLLAGEKEVFMVPIQLYENFRALWEAIHPEPREGSLNDSLRQNETSGMFSIEETASGSLLEITHENAE